ncbi:flagellar hook-length control protein FliK [Paenibacillus macerans]|uniref:flagellar hook-length control protein FliK n=1 Tax=Paenibacillus macerans TaxID=44252 RepID=UPI0020425AAF|nr:flagellar hook-length control protein FliK [Paenibacillus macerans]MCM3699258.1 flagellar hook-length control protein FliK [Paenibacillus macerans]
MNIGPLLRGMLGNAQAGEPKTLELKTGQVVRGTVLSVSENGQEAVIQVQGVKLHAALETPMRPGETTLLQVQPESQNGLAVLRPMSSLPGAELSAASLAKALQSLGLEDTATNRELLQLMQKSGVPLTKENVSQILQVSGQKPGGVPLSEWIQAAGIAFSRGLPLTGETVAGLHQAVFGPPLHTLLSALDEQIANFLGQAAGNSDGAATPGSGTSGSSAGGAAVQGQQAQAGPSAAALTNTASSGSGAAAAGTTAGGAGVAGASTQPNQAAGMVQLALRGAAAGALEGQTPRPGNPGGSGSASLSGGALVAKLQAVLAELDGAMLQEGMAEAAPGRGTGDGGAAPSAGTLGGSGAAAGSAAAAPQAQGEGAAGPSPAGTRPTLAAEPWVGRVLKLLGAEHEQQVRAAAPSAAAAQAQEAPPAAGASAKPAGGAELPGGQAPGSGPAAAPGGATGSTAPPVESRAAQADARAAGGTAPAPANAEEAAATRSSALAGGSTVGATAAGAAASGGAVQDTLKGLLLQMAAADDLPAPLQEAARQLVQQLTGQQLLLNTDRTAPFAQVTMFLPFFGPDGKQTASVHIESRRGRKGELDPANCRLWFDLQMKTLGQIMVDVQVADKKVLLKLFSEQEATGAFLESRQEEISEALLSVGYRLLSMKSEPLIPAESKEGGATDFSLPLTYAPSPYKGVDYRV